MGEKEKGPTALWRCLHRMYNCLLALPVLSLLGVVLLLGGNFEGDIKHFRQIRKDLKDSSKLLSVARHFSTGTAFVRAARLNSSQEERMALERQTTLTLQLLGNAKDWMPRPCRQRFQLEEESGIFQTFLSALPDGNETKDLSESGIESLEEFVSNLTVCSMSAVPRTMLRREPVSLLVYQHLLAASMSMQHSQVRHEHGCRLASKYLSTTFLQSRKYRGHEVMADFWGEMALPVGNFTPDLTEVAPSLDVFNRWALENFTLSRTSLFYTFCPESYANESECLPDPCSPDRLDYSKGALRELTLKTSQAHTISMRDVEALLKTSETDLVSRSFLVIATVGALSVALFKYGSTCQRSREMSRAVVDISILCRRQSRRKGSVLALCVPRELVYPSTEHQQNSQEESFKVSATLLSFDIPGLDAVVQADAEAALVTVSQILALVHDKALKHHAFLLQQRNAACVIAAGPAVGFVCVGSPVRYVLAGDLTSVAVQCQTYSHPDCIRISRETYTALQKLDLYICLEASHPNSEPYSNADNYPEYYLAGKRTIWEGGV